MKNGSQGKNMVKSLIVQTLSFLSSTASSFVLAPVLAFGLGDYGYGIWIFANTITSYFTLSDFGLSSSMRTHLAQSLGKGDSEQYNKYYSSGQVLYFIIACIVTLILLSVEMPLWFILPQKHLLIEVIFINGLNLALAFPFYPYTSVLASHIRYDILSWLTIVQTLSTLVTGIVTVKLHYGLITLSLASLITNLVINVVTLIFARYVCDSLKFLRTNVRKSAIVELLKYSVKTLFVQAGDLLRFGIDDVVTASGISLAKVPHYTVANRLVTTANGLAMTFMSSFAAKISQSVGKGDADAVSRDFITSFKLLISMSSTVFIGFIVIGKPFLDLWMGPHFADSYGPLLILGAAYFVARSQSSVVSLLYSLNRHHYYGYINIFEGVLNLTLSLFFVVVMKLGINGVALGTLIPILITKFLFQPYLVRVNIGIRIRKFYFIFLKTIAPGIVGFTIIEFIIKAFNIKIHSYFSCLGVCIILLLLFLIQLFLSLNSKERNALLKVVQTGFAKIFRRAHTFNDVQL